MLRACQATLLGLAVVGCQIGPPQPPPPAPEALEAARQIVSRLDYIAANYPSTVRSQTVIDAAEYDEQLQMLGEIRARLATLDELEPERARGDKAAIDLVESRVREKAAGETVSGVARETANGVLSRHELVLAPIAVPDRARGRTLFSDNCVKCHGPGGAGDGPQRDELKVKPRDLTAPEVTATLSMRRVFNTLTDGIAAAEMPQFNLLSVDDRWSIAAYVLTLPFAGPGPSDKEVGVAAPEPPGWIELANRTNAELETSLGADGLAHARTVLTFARPPGLLSPINDAVARAVAKHREGKRPEASDNLDAAIAEVFAPLRPGLLARQRAVAWELETELYALRAAIESGSALELEQRAHLVFNLVGSAEAELDALAPVALAGAAGLAGLGWIAVLILCGGAAARASGFRKVGSAVNAGWIIAAIAGVATLFVSGGEMDLSDASQRHALIAALRIAGAAGGAVAAIALLRRLAVPVNRHAPESADAMPWWLAMVVFAIGYGGVLEVTAEIARIASATGASKLILLGGAAVVVGAIAALLRLLAQARQVIGDAPFFGVTATLALIAAIALAGQAAHGLFDIGIATPSLNAGLRFDPLALYPTATTAGAQLAIAALVAGGAIFLLLSRRAAMSDGAAAGS